IVICPGLIQSFHQCCGHFFFSTFFTTSKASLFTSVNRCFLGPFFLCVGGFGLFSGFILPPFSQLFDHQLCLHQGTCIAHHELAQVLSRLQTVSNHQRKDQS